MNETKSILLPSGRSAVIRPPKGRDLIAAQQVSPSPEHIGFGLMAALVTIDGNRLVLEDYLEMDLSDILVLQTAVMGNVPSQAPSTSSSSPTTPAGVSAS